MANQRRVKGVKRATFTPVAAREATPIAEAPIGVHNEKEKSTQKPMGANKKTLIVIGILLGLLLAGLGVSWKLYMDAQAKIKSLQEQVVANPLVTNKEEAKALVDRVTKHLVLPHEEPRVITITDVTQLKAQQPFFEQATNGDVVLVYGQKVILYSPKLDKVIDIAQIRETTVSAGLAPQSGPFGPTPTVVPSRAPTPQTEESESP